MRKALLTTLLMLSTIPALAQSALGIGLHEAENNVDISYTGTGWTTVVDFSNTYVQSDTAGDLMSFEFTGGALLVYRNMVYSPFVESNPGDALYTPLAIGDVAGIDYRRAQQFSPASSGAISEFTFELDTNNFNPAGQIGWQLRSDSSNLPGALLMSGSVTPIPNATNTVNVSNGVTLIEGTNYWLVLFANPQNNNQYYRWRTSDGTYNKPNAQSSNSGTSWSLVGNPAAFSVTTQSAPDVEMCLDGVCSTISNYSDFPQYRVPVGFVPSAPGTHTFTIENLEDGNFQVDNLLVLPASESGGSTVIPIDIQYPAPEDTVSFDVSGQPSSFSYSMSAGDVMTNVLLVALIVLSISQLLVGMLWKN
jgi:hypothetical protein